MTATARFSIRSLAASCAALLALSLFSCASAPAPSPTVELTPERLYPMPLGSAWSYDVDTGDGSAPVLAITRVIEASEGRASIQGGEGTTHYQLRADGIYCEERGGYLLKAPIRPGARWPSGHGVQARIQNAKLTLETAVGRFSGCVEVLEQGSSTGAVITTSYCPEVGPVQVISSMQLELAQQSVRVVARLRGYRVGPESATQRSSQPSAQAPAQQ